MTIAGGISSLLPTYAPELVSFAEGWLEWGIAANLIRQSNISFVEHLWGFAE